MSTHLERLSRNPSPMHSALRELADAELTREIKAERGIDWTPPEQAAASPISNAPASPRGVSARKAALRRDVDEYLDYLDNGGSSYASFEDWQEAV